MTEGFRIRYCFFFFTAIALLCATTVAQGAIYQWELDSQGKKKASVLVCNDGENVTAGPNADLSKKNLTKAYLEKTNLINANFYQATLSYASFDSAALYGTVFNNAEVGGAFFNNTTSLGFTEPQFQSTKSYNTDKKFWYVGTDSSNNFYISGINLSGNFLMDWNFQGQDLTKASFNSSLLAGADFTGATLTNASFDSATLNASIKSATLNAFFKYTTLNEADFTGAIINGSTKDYEYVQGKTVTMTLPGADFSNSNLTQRQLKSTKSYNTDKNLSGIKLAGNDLTNWDFHGQNLTNASFISSALSRADFTNATLTNASLNSASLAGAIFTNADIAGANFNDTTDGGFTMKQLKTTASYINNDLVGIRLGGNDLSGWDFQGQDLTNASFESGTLFGAVMSNANIIPPNIRNMAFDASSLERAIFTDALIGGANFNFTTSRGFTQAQLKATKSYQDKDLSGISLMGNNLINWEFQGQNLTNAFFNYSDLSGANLSQTTLTNASFAGASLTGAVLSGATVSGADFSYTKGLTQAQLKSTQSYNNDLSGIKLKGTNLSGWDLNGQTLVFASFDSADLRNANLSGSNIRVASFAGADLRAADFTNSDIRGALDSSSGTIYRTSFFLTPTLTQKQLQSTNSYINNDLTYVSLAMNKLNGWDFRAKNLGGANIAGASLSKADFTDAIVNGVEYTKTNGSTKVITYSAGADFSDTDLTQDQLKTTASYKKSELMGIALSGNNISGWDLNGQNLSNANFYFTTMKRTNFSNATIKGANLTFATSKGFTQQQLQSTASYIKKDLSGINFTANNFSGWDFHEQDLSNAFFNGATLNGANFTLANLTNVNLYSLKDYTTNLKATDFTGADMRGAKGKYNIRSGATDVKGNPWIEKNTIWIDGTIGLEEGNPGLDLSDGSKLIVRNYAGDPLDSTPELIPIIISNKMKMGTNGTLQMVFDDSNWNSTISFDSGIPVTLGGTLELTFKEGLDTSQLVDKSFTLFDWTGVNLKGTKFNNVVDENNNVVDDTVWDVTALYTTGIVTYKGAALSAGVLQEIVITPIPEPASLMLWMMGLLSILAWKFHRDMRP